MNQTFGSRLKNLLERKNISQRDLAKKVDTTEATISRYINSVQYPRVEIINKISQALKVPADYLLGNTNSIIESEDQKTIEDLLREKGLDSKEINIVQNVIDSILKE